MTRNDGVKFTIKIVGLRFVLRSLVRTVISPIAATRLVFALCRFNFARFVSCISGTASKAIKFIIAGTPINTIQRTAPLG
ncbi:MAG: hypothetical protein DMG16_15440 [Acidobacteria bacterium]|nr:MAG: hypothetical protein DMG16_15440 [Acidobacteriota bacterium]